MKNEFQRQLEKVVEFQIGLVFFIGRYAFAVAVEFLGLCLRNWQVTLLVGFLAGMLYLAAYLGQLIENLSL